MAPLKYFLVAYFITYLVVAFLWPSVRTYRQTGINPVVFESGDDAHSYIGKWFKILMVLVFVCILMYVFAPSWNNYLVPISYLNSRTLQLAGMALCVGSFAWTTIAQAQMGKSWRIGIDTKNRTDLKTKGLFSVSRNPIFMGMITTLIGYFLLLPNALTLVIATMGYLLIQIQIRLEEEFLSREHGMVYESYKKAVRRLL